MSFSAVLLIFALLFCSNAQKPCLPVLIIHGLFESADRLKPLATAISTAPDCPNGRNVTIIYLNEYVQSTIPLWQQVEMFQMAMLPYFEANPDGIHVIGYSQGTLISRAVVEITNNHPVHSLVSIEGVQCGLSGHQSLRTEFMKLATTTQNLLLPFTTNFWLVCYNPLAQSVLSICNFWRDEYYYDLYKKYVNFLPYINNEINHENATRYKTNLVALKKFAMISSKDDEFISPWQSGLFGSLNVNGTITDMENQWFYKNDTLGLKTLNIAGKLFLHNISGVGHVDIPNDETVIRDYVIPYLD